MTLPFALDLAHAYIVDRRYVDSLQGCLPAATPRSSIARNLSFLDRYLTLSGERRVHQEDETAERSEQRDVAAAHRRRLIQERHVRQSTELESTEALHTLYSRHSAGIRRYLARMVGEADAEDLVQDVFERAQRAVTTLDDEQHASAWLYRIARNAALDRRRSRMVREREDVVGALRDGAAGCEPRPDIDLARAQTRACILDLVERLAPSHRAVVLLSELRGLSDRETADSLAVTLGAAKIRLHRARRALRDLMECECRTFRDERNELACEPARPRTFRVVG